MNSFDAKAAEWDDSPLRREMNRSIAATIREAVPLDPSMSVLDFGCGTGLISRELFPNLGKILAVDLSAGMIEQLQKRIDAEKIPNITPRRLDIFTDPLNETFDLIYSAMAIHHVKETGPLIDRLTACLNPGGWIALADLDTEDGSFHQETEGFIHHGLDRKMLCRQLEERGLENVKERTAHIIRKETGDYPVFLITGDRPPII
jgi:cyclopropane fatty-acyl-phospholipid synthase-like methyltransferase